MQTFIQYILPLFPVPLFYLIYLKYFLFEPNHLKHFEFFLRGVALGIFILLLNTFLDHFIVFHSAGINGFLRAALPEKGLLFLILILSNRRNRQEFHVAELMADAGMIGLGYSFFENISYAVNSGSGSLLFTRFFSAVPLHITTSCLMGFYIGLARIQTVSVLKYFRFIQALFVPFFFHGLFDTLLFLGGSSVYLTAPLLIFLIIFLDFRVALSQSFPSGEILQRMGINFEEWGAIKKQIQFERWILRSLGSFSAVYDPLFQWKTGKWRIISVFLLVLFAILYYPYHSFFGFDKYFIRLEEEYSFFILFPAFFALNLVLVGIVNPDYFRNSILRIPVITEVHIIVAGQELREITYDITTSCCFLKTAETIKIGEEVRLAFHIPGMQDLLVRGTVVWDNHTSLRQQFGTVVRFSDTPEKFRKYLGRSFLRKIWEGFIFNFRLPGFEIIQRLFLQPESVMQDIRFLKKGTLVFKEGEPGDEFFMIKKGTVRIYKTLGTGTDTDLASIGEGQIFGEMAITGTLPRNASAICDTDCILNIADGNDLDALIHGNPEFAKNLLRIAAQRLMSSGETLSEKISNLENRLRLLKNFDYAALLLLLIGSGTRARDGVLNVEIDLGALKRSGIDREAAKEILSFATREKTVVSPPFIGKEPALKKSIRKLLNSYRIKISGKKPK